MVRRREVESGAAVAPDMCRVAMEHWERHPLCITELWRLTSQRQIVTCLVFSAAHYSFPCITPVPPQKLLMIWSIMALLPCLVSCDRLETEHRMKSCNPPLVSHIAEGSWYYSWSPAVLGMENNSRNVQTLNNDAFLVPQPQTYLKASLREVFPCTAHLHCYKHSVVPGYLNLGKTLVRKQRQWLLDGSW